MSKLAGKRILVVTAGALQQTVIQKAQALGLWVLATDRNAAAPGLKLADQAEVVDTLDLEAVLRVARAHGVDGVITEQTDVAVPTAAYVAEKMGLPGIGYQVSLNVTNKWLMRERCREAGLPGPKYRRVTTPDDAVSAAEEIGTPVVLKPLDAQSSRGVAKIWDAAEIPKWFERTKNYSRDGSLLVEEMMTGTESSAEGFVADGRVHVFGVCDKVKCPPPYSYDLRLIYPAFFACETVAEIHALNERVVRAVGITMGTTHAEYIVTPQGVRLLEIAARGCGARVATHLIPALTGVDPVEARIRQAVGGDAGPLDAAFQKSGLLEFLMLPPGKIKSIAGVEEARRIPGVIEVGYNVKAGDRVGVVESGEGRPGYLLAVAESRDGLLSILDEVTRTLRVEMET